jgi:hypothetical protein
VSETSYDVLTSLLSSPETRGLVRTDGCGKPLSVSGLDDGEARSIAERADLMLAATTAFGRATALGAPATVVIDYQRAVVVVGVHTWGEHVIVLGAEGANVGLLLSRLRRLLASDAHERERA